MKKISVACFLFLAMFTNAVFAAGWQSLGSKSVSGNGDRDVIQLRGPKEFSKIRVKNRGPAPIEINKMTINFKSGGSQNVRVGRIIREGEESRIIDVKGKKRDITNIVFWYDAKGLGRNRATVSLLGR